MENNTLGGAAYERAMEQVREQYRRIGETQRQCQAAIIAIAQVMDWGPAELNRIIGAPFFNVPPTPPSPHAPESENPPEDIQ